MACGCNQAATAAPGSGWYYISPQGNRTLYPSEVEARAAFKRAGDRGSVQQA